MDNRVFASIIQADLILSPYKKRNSECFFQMLHRTGDRRL